MCISIHMDNCFAQLLTFAPRACCGGLTLPLKEPKQSLPPKGTSPRRTSLKKTLRGLACLATLLTLGALPAVVAGGAQKTAGLEHLPDSGDVLMARAIMASTVHLPTAQVTPRAATPSETCTPAPCVLPNEDASESGSNPVNEDPIAVNPNNSSQWTTRRKRLQLFHHPGIFRPRRQRDHVRPESP